MFVIIKDANPLLLYLVKIFNPLQTSTSVGIRCKRAKGIADLRQFWPVLAQISYGFRGGDFLFCWPKEKNSPSTPPIILLHAKWFLEKHLIFFPLFAYNLCPTTLWFCSKKVKCIYFRVVYRTPFNNICWLLFMTNTNSTSICCLGSLWWACKGERLHL